MGRLTKIMIYNVEQLRRAYQAGGRFKYMMFWGHTPPADGTLNASCFSQWWKCSFEIEGVAYSCTEQYMMAEKARLFEDEEMLEKILEARHPKEMKAYGRAVKGFDQQLWEQQRYDIVKRGNLAKFTQDQDLGEVLRNTKQRILVEASPRDRIWGIGMGKSNPDAENPMKWRGQNLLGFALTEVRDQMVASR